MEIRNPTRLLCLTLALALLAGCGGQDDGLSALRERGHLKVGTLPVPGTFTTDGAGSFGLEVTLVRAWVSTIGVEAEFLPYPSRDALLNAVALGEVDMAAASLAVDPAARDRVRFTSIYLHEPILAVYRRGSPRPRDEQALADRVVVAASGLVPAPRRVPRVRADRALAMVHERDADVALVQRRHLEATRLALPHLREAFDTGTSVALAWAFPRAGGNELYRHAERWLRKGRGDGSLARLREDAEGHRPDFDHVAMLFWQRHLEERLPRFEPLFREAGERTGLDWRLLAAVAYQESHWKADAVSPTGVRGLMMLTRPTAREMGVRRRTDPAQSVDGGARYLQRLIDRQGEIPGAQDRVWLALAAYNVGHGHVQDAMALTRAHGREPTRWADVRAHLPLLEDARFHRATRYGYARGREPVRYVSNIRRYYDALRLESVRQDALRRSDTSSLRPSLIQSPSTRSVSTQTPSTRSPSIRSLIPPEPT